MCGGSHVLAANLWLASVDARLLPPRPQSSSCAYQLRVMGSTPCMPVRSMLEAPPWWALTPRAGGTCSLQAGGVVHAFAVRVLKAICVWCCSMHPKLPLNTACVHDTP